MPAKDTTLGSRVTQAQPFSAFLSKRGDVGVRIGERRTFASTRELFIGQTAQPVMVRATKDGLLISGEGVVRECGDTIRITA